VLFEINHVTRYTYSAPVGLEPMTLRLHPRSDAHQTARRYQVVITPTPSGISHCVGLDGNNEDTIWFDGLLDSLKIEVNTLVETHQDDPFNFLITDASALKLPLKYEPHLETALSHYLLRNYQSSLVEIFAQEIMQTAKYDTITFLMLLAEQIPTRLRYMLREHGDSWTPEVTLQHGEGACRDFSVLFMDVCRIAGIAARFVSGYCIGDEADNSHMHAWVEVYLPGAGWRGFDPSRGVTISDDHVAVAAGCNTQDAAPTTGNYRGSASSTMMADISVRILENKDAGSSH
jgi:transglutaminase-like putative cysteine protease